MLTATHPAMQYINMACPFTGVSNRTMPPTTPARDASTPPSSRSSGSFLTDNYNRGGAARARHRQRRRLPVAPRRHRRQWEYPTRAPAVAAAPATSCTYHYVDLQSGRPALRARAQTGDSNTARGTSSSVSDRGVMMTVPWPIVAADRPPRAGDRLVPQRRHLPRAARRVDRVRPARTARAATTPVKGRHNVPVLGWLVLRGRCASCRAPISARYPLVEAGHRARCSSRSPCASG